MEDIAIGTARHGTPIALHAYQPPQIIAALDTASMAEK